MISLKGSAGLSGHVDFSISIFMFFWLEPRDFGQKQNGQDDWIIVKLSAAW